MTKTDTTTVETVLTSTEAALAQAKEAGHTVYQRGKRIVAIAQDGTVLFLGGAASEPVRTWDVMTPIAG